MPTNENVAIVELYDCGVRISDGQKILADSESCALIESESSILTGAQAKHQAHLRPRECSTQFWSKLSETSNTKHKISNAEIAYQHLKGVWKSANCINHSVILVTPVTLDKRALGLLLGICKKLSINVVGITSNAILSMRQQSIGCQAIYLDLLQDEIAISEIVQTESGLNLKQPSRILNFGLRNFMQNCAAAISGQFTSKTRYDPLHTAEDEQQFYDKLPLWLTALDKDGLIECKISKNDQIFNIEIDKEYLTGTNLKLFEEVAANLNVLLHNHELVAIFCSTSCTQVFGLTNYLLSLPGCAVEQLDANALAEQAMICKHEIISDEQIHYVNSLNWNNKSIANELDFSPGRLSNLSNNPTHLLINGHAYDLQQNFFIAINTASDGLQILLEKTPESVCKIYANKLSVEIEVINSHKISLNTNAVTSKSIVTVGDKLTVHDDGTICQFIKVYFNET